MILGVVADDVTGAGDIGGMTATAGYPTRIHVAGDAVPGAATLTGADVTILDTDSRLDDAPVAYRKVHAATRALREAGCERFFNKTCSVFRGNVGAEFDAMLDALDEDFAVVVLGFPRNGRITRDGIHYVHGVRLEASPFRNDPIHPATRSDLVGILQAQTERRVGRLGHEVVAQGAVALREAITARRGRDNYLILDVVDGVALATIAHAVGEVRVLCGASSLAEPLAAAWPPPTHTDPPPLPPRDGLGVLCVAGSLTPQTAEQLAHLAARGVARVTLDPRRLFFRSEGEEEIARCVAACAAATARGDDAALRADSSPEAVVDARTAGAASGLPGHEAARRVSAGLAEVAARVRARVGLTRLVVAGGDTSAAVCRRLGVHTLRVREEIRPGLPSCLAEGGPPLLLVLKSGSFGPPGFLAEAAAHLRDAGTGSPA